MDREEPPIRRRRRLLAALLVTLAFLGTVALAQSPQAVSSEDHRGYRDLVPLDAGIYGVELRGTDDSVQIEARVGPNTSLADKFRSTRILAKATQPFVVKWSAREVSANAGGQSINNHATWQTGDAVRISVRGDTRVTIVKAGGRLVDQKIAGTQSPGTTSDLILAGAHLTGAWTLEGTIDWPAEPGPDDAVFVTAGRQPAHSSFSGGGQPAALPLDRKRPNMFTGGIADPFVFSPPSGTTRRVGGTPREVTLTWTGAAGGQNSRKWSVAANWDPQRVPATGDVVEFGSRGREKSPH